MNETCAVKGRQENFEFVAIEFCAKQFGMEASAARSAIGREGFQDALHGLDLSGRRFNTFLRNGLVRRARVALAARFAGICLIAEVTHEPLHAAAVAVSKARHFFELPAAMFNLCAVRLSPDVGAAGRELIWRYDGTAVDPEFFEGFLEGVPVHLGFFLELVSRDRFVTQQGK